MTTFRENAHIAMLYAIIAIVPVNASAQGKLGLPWQVTKVIHVSHEHMFPPWYQAFAEFSGSPDSVEQERWQPWGLGTISIQTLTGLVGGGVVTAAMIPIFPNVEILGPVGAYTVGAFVGIPWGVYLGGKLMGGRGKFSDSFLGGLAGGGLILGLSIVSSGKTGASLIILAPVAIVAGSIIGYHWFATTSPLDSSSALFNMHGMYDFGIAIPMVDYSVRYHAGGSYDSISISLLSIIL